MFKGVNSYKDKQINYLEIGSFYGANILSVANTYGLHNDSKLYFDNNYIVKDDQLILIDCILTEIDKFTLYRENHPIYDNWFMFQRILM